MLLLFCVLTTALGIAGEIPKDDEELRLITDLFREFDRRIRPVRHKSEPVTVIFGVAYVQLVDLSEKDQMMKSNVWVRQTWNNTFLTWEPADYGNISTINVDPRKVWLPDIMLYNSAKSGSDAGTMYQFKTKVILKSTGLSQWYAPAIIRSGCNIDITYFPFDDQLCQLTFGSWAFTGSEINLINDGPTADIAEYLKSSEFDLVSANAYRKVKKFSCCPETYPNIIYVMHLRRQPGFFLYNVIIPSMVMTCFAILTFTSPHLTGERVGLAIESFLSLSFLCLMVSQSIPVISDVTPLITKFLLTCMCMISLAVVFNLISLNLLCTTVIPPWLRFTVFHVLGPLVGVCVAKEPLSSETAKSLIIQANYPDVDEFLESSGERDDATETSLLNPLQLFRRLSRHRIGKPAERHQKSEFQVLKRKPKPTKMDTIGNHMEVLIRKSDAEAATKLNRDFWRCVAQTLDRMFLLSFILSFIFVSTFMMLKGFGHHMRET